jgi:hypothetical protein
VLFPVHVPAGGSGRVLVFVLRLLHIVGGVFWAGAIFFFVTYVEPAVRAAGPDGAKVLVQMFLRRYLTVLPVVAGVTILSGVWLMWITSMGFAPFWWKTPLGRGITVGSIAALVGFVIGLAVMRPAAVRLWAIARQMPHMQDEGRRAALATEAASLRNRALYSARAVAVFLFIAVASMATAMYW